MSPRPKLKEYRNPIYAFKSKVSLECNGTFRAKVEYHSYSTFADFVAMEDSGNLLTYNTGKDLHIINIVNKVSGESNTNSLETWKAKYPSVFSGKIGKLENFKLK